MTEHVHQCPHCGDSGLFSPCPDCGLPVLWPCSDCEEPIAEVDDLPNPVPGLLSHVAIERVVARATRAALDVAARHPEDAPSKFADHVDPLYAKDPTRPDPDVWARNGAVMGAKSGWSGDLAFRGLPPDCPRGPAARCYMGAWSFASGVVMQIRLEVGNHG